MSPKGQQEIFKPQEVAVDEDYERFKAIIFQAMGKKQGVGFLSAFSTSNTVSYQFCGHPIYYGRKICLHFSQQKQHN